MKNNKFVIELKNGMHVSNCYLKYWDGITNNG